MDGYAVRAADVANAPVTLTVIGEVAAGHPFDGEVRAGASRAHLHRRRDAGRRRHRRHPGTHRRATATPSPSKKPSGKGRNVRPQGIDFNEGDVLLRKGQRLTDRDLMLAAGDELSARCRCTAGPRSRCSAPATSWCRRAATPARARSSIPTALRSSRWRAAKAPRSIDLGIARDKVEDIAAAVRRARDVGADILVTTGGASVGDHDLVQQALAAEGLELSFWRVALRPGRPMMHGRLGAHAGARRARQSGVVLCLRVPVPGAADPQPVGRARRRAASRSRPARPRPAGQ